ncbi:FecR domain-containing protein [Marinobacter sp. BGYM27]|uniref:FecR domain-containing protein n=1 Tax=Marinobacter sp. BGYM27 TaxID=2975597 RepID=UPI0021A91AB4|nr:FecR domain-containing protein [Marinobacter sp. BGYM27]MDG5498688.1 FecR domain-containing protein [Marinobacter sp. BGYM27]
MLKVLYSLPLHAVLALALCLPAALHAELPVAQGSSTGSYQQATGTRTADWTYTLRPDETLGQISKRLLGNGHTLASLTRYNSIGDPSAVMPGESIRIPLNWLEKQPEPAVALAVTGSAQHLEGISGKRRTLKPQMQIRAGDEVSTQSGSAVIQLANGSLIRMGQDSHLIFNRLTRYGKTGMVDTLMRLERGSLEADVEALTENGSRFEIDTPSAIAAVRGTAFKLQSGKGITQLQVTEGKVAFGPPGRTLPVPAGYSATAGKGTQSAVDIRKLPAAPEMAPLPANASRLPLDIKWQPVAGANRYQLDIYDSASGRWVAREQSVNPELTLKHLDNGKYDIKLAAIGASGISGMPSEQTIKLQQQAKAANLVAPAADDKIDDDVPDFSWAYTGDNELGRVEISDSDDFSSLVASSEWAPDSNAILTRALSPGEYFWRVVTLAGGDSKATSPARKLIINGTLEPAKIINVNYVDSQVRIFWQRVAKADKYQLQLSEDPAFQNIVKEANVTDTTAALRLIPGRRYFVRLKALSDGPISGRWGSGRELFVN